MSDSVLTCRSIVKTYKQGPQLLTVLNELNFDVKAGQHIAIIGASGSGKSTLLNILGGLDKPEAGEVEVLGKPFSALSENARGKIRNQHLGFVYQFHHLLGEFSALENTALPLLIGKTDKKRAFERAKILLEKVGLGARLQHKPSQLSGGERQRVAIARALANEPLCVLMDEPTGNLDEGNAAAIQQLMQDLSDSLNTTFIVVTHDQAFAETMDEIYELSEGSLNRKARTVSA